MAETLGTSTEGLKRSRSEKFSSSRNFRSRKDQYIVNGNEEGDNEDDDDVIIRPAFSQTKQFKASDPVSGFSNKKSFFLDKIPTFFCSNRKNKSWSIY